MTSIHTIIPYCTYDKSFIKDVVDAACQVTDKVWISYSDFFLNGDPEDLESIKSLIDQYKDNQKVSFIKYKTYINDHITIKHNLSRSVLIDNARMHGATHLLLLDADELIDVKRFNKWKEESFIPNIPCYRFKNYWYFRKTTYQATTLEHTTTLAKIELHEGFSLMAPERDYYLRNGYVLVDKIDGEAIIHHYSWAKTKEELLLKVRNWGHYKEKDWSSLIEEEFSRDFNGTDFVHNYSYVILDKPFTNESNNSIV